MRGASPGRKWGGRSARSGKGPGPQSPRPGLAHRQALVVVVIMKGRQQSPGQEVPTKEREQGGRAAVAGAEEEGERSAQEGAAFTERPGRGEPEPPVPSGGVPRDR